MSYPRVLSLSRSKHLAMYACQMCSRRFSLNHQGGCVSRGEAVSVLGQDTEPQVSDSHQFLSSVSLPASFYCLKDRHICSALNVRVLWLIKCSVIVCNIVLYLFQCPLTPSMSLSFMHPCLFRCSLLYMCALPGWRKHVWALCGSSQGCSWACICTWWGWEGLCSVDCTLQEGGKTKNWINLLWSSEPEHCMVKSQKALPSVFPRVIPG